MIVIIGGLRNYPVRGYLLINLDIYALYGVKSDNFITLEIGIRKVVRVKIVP